MAYTEAQKQAAVDALIRAMPHLNRTVAYQWVNSEQGSCNNILGVTSSSGHCGQYNGGHQGCGGIYRLCSFDTFAAAAAAARSLIYGSSIHSKLANAIEHGSGTQQAQALVDSRWGGGAGWWPYFVALYPYFQSLTPPDHLPTAHKASVLALVKRYPDLKKFDIIKRLLAGDTGGGGGSGGGSGGSGGSEDPNFKISDCATKPYTRADGAWVFPFLKRQCVRAILNVDDNHVLTAEDFGKLIQWKSDHGGIGGDNINWYSFLTSHYDLIQKWLTGKKVGNLSAEDAYIPTDSGTPAKDDPFGLTALGDTISRGIIFLAIFLLGLALIYAAAVLAKKQGASEEPA